MSRSLKKKSFVAIIMGSKSDWKILKQTAIILKKLNIPFFTQIVSAHRTPFRMIEFAKKAKSKNISVIIAGAGGSAHLPGMTAAITDLPVIGVPIETKSLKGLDSLLSIVQMPYGIPVGTVAIGETGAKNAALYAASIMSLKDKDIAKRLSLWRSKQTQSVKLKPKN